LPTEYNALSEFLKKLNDSLGTITVDGDHSVVDLGLTSVKFE
jgi:hypothetical protein